MKYTIWLSLLATMFYTSCHPSSGPTANHTPADTSETGQMKIMVPSSTCYTHVAGKDSVWLKVEVFPNVVTGRLTYKLFEKDANKGEYDGRLFGDTLVASYRFMSEGKQSVRQVIFLLKDGTATEGYGEMEERDSGMVFKNLQQVSFDKGMVLTKSACGEY